MLGNCRSVLHLIASVLDYIQMAVFTSTDTLKFRDLDVNDRQKIRKLSIFKMTDMTLCGSPQHPLEGHKFITITKDMQKSHQVITFSTIMSSQLQLSGPQSMCRAYHSRNVGWVSLQPYETQSWCSCIEELGIWLFSVCTAMQAVRGVTCHVLLALLGCDVRSFCSFHPRDETSF